MALIDIIIKYPRISIILLGFLVTLGSMLVSKFIVDQGRMKELKEKQKNAQQRMKEHRGNVDKMAEIQKEMMEASMEMMKHSFKPMLITMIPLLLIFGFIRNTFTQTDISQSWYWYYLTTAILSSFILRKPLDM